MTKVTVTIDTKSKDEIKLLEDRWADYITHTKNVQSWDEVKKKLVEKYGKKFKGV